MSERRFYATWMMRVGGDVCDSLQEAKDHAETCVAEEGPLAIVFEQERYEDPPGIERWRDIRQWEMTEPGGDWSWSSPKASS